jgi:hypothetical protein
MKLHTFFRALLALAMQTAVFAQPPAPGASPGLKDTVVLIIRHAEKPKSGQGLAPAGMARSQAYPGYFQNYTIDGKPLKLDCLIATADTRRSHRPRLTVEPLSKASGLAIDLRFTEGDAEGLVAELRAAPHGKAILIAWHHGEIAALVRALGADPGRVIPGGRWPEGLYDRLIQLRFDAQGRLYEAEGISEHLMPGDPDQPPAR